MHVTADVKPGLRRVLAASVAVAVLMAAVLEGILAAFRPQTYGLLDRIQGRAADHGATLVVVAIPAREQIDDAFWRTLRDRQDLPGDVLDRDLPQMQLRRWADQRGVPLVDLLPQFRTAGDGPYYLGRDSHWNAAGHRLAADLIRTALVNLGLVPA